MAPYMKSQILLLLSILVAATILPEGGESASFLEVRVQIINKLAKNQDMMVHCKDKHHDLGQPRIQSEKMFEFSLQQHPFIPNVLYFCSFWWQSLPKALYFDIYKQTRDSCSTCVWEIYDSGPCKDGGRHCYPWNDNSQTLLVDGAAH